VASETIRYQPGEAVRWLQTGADALRKRAKAHGVSLVRREGERSLGRDLGDAAGVLLDAGKGAVADLLHRQAEARSYTLMEDRFIIAGPTGKRTITYAEVGQIRLAQDKVTVVLPKGSVTITPYAHIVAGRVRVPVGWSRNGLEVPYELLIEELAARCGVDVESA